MSDGATRRQFLRAAATGTTGLLLGCGSQREDRTNTCRDADRPRLDATPGCLETEDNILGPFYREGAPMKSNFLESGMSGTRLAVSGRVLDPACVPLAGALLDVWQADDAGRYDAAGYVLRGKVLADTDGQYAFETIVPGHYLNGDEYRPAHIHAIVSAAGVQTLTTQLYFEGDEYNAGDPWFLPCLAMALEDVGDGTKRAAFDIVLVPA